MVNSSAPLVALLRGINVTGHNKIPMADLRSICASLGWNNVQSYIQSGNLVFTAADPPARLEAGLEQAIEQHFGLSIPVIVRSGKKWLQFTKGNPFPTESESTPNLVILALSKDRPKAGAVSSMQGRARQGEQVCESSGVLWMYFPSGFARSSFPTAVLDRLVGSTVTCRNWRTVQKLSQMLSEFQ